MGSRVVNTSDGPLPNLDTNRDDTTAEDLQRCTDWPWQQVVSRCVTSLHTLADLLQLDTAQLVTPQTSDAFPLKVPLTFIRKMRKGDPSDPLLLQVLAQAIEDESVDGYVDDPVAEHDIDVRGLIRKYPGRALLTAASACPIHCRYCFRRHFPYADNRLSPASWAPALSAIAADTSLSEVILSGGDPLMLKDELLEALLMELDAIPHLDLLRIHTRFPGAVPQRVTDGFVTLLSRLRCRTTVVLHVNHGNEIDDAFQSHLEPLLNSPVTLLNQSTLLLGVNDDVDSLERLSRNLHQAGVLPYYLHVLDRVRGAAHFDVCERRAIELMGALRARVPGYLLPRLVRETPGRLSKTPVPELLHSS